MNFPHSIETSNNELISLFKSEVQGEEKIQRDHLHFLSKQLTFLGEKSQMFL